MNKGFSLYELMVTVAILSFGLVMIYESFFLIADTAGSLPYYIKSQFLMDEIIWSEEDALRRNGHLTTGTKGGKFLIDNKELSWRSRTVHAPKYGKNIYEVDVNFSWKSKEKVLENSCSAYVRE